MREEQKSGKISEVEIFGDIVEELAPKIWEEVWIVSVNGGDTMPRSLIVYDRNSRSNESNLIAHELHNNMPQHGSSRQKGAN